MSLLSLLGSSFVGQNIPFDDTIAFNVDTVIDNDPDYHYTGDLIRNPTNGKVIHFFSNGDTHLWNDGRKVSAKVSLDNGNTYGVISDWYIPSSPWGVIDCSGNYDSTGKLHLFVNVKDSAATPGNWELRYLTSIDDGQTFSAAQTITTPSDLLVIASPYNTLMENNGVLLKPFYKTNDGSESANYLLRSTDYGQNWTTITVRAKDTPYYNESSIVALDNSNLLMMYRDEPNGGWQQYRSTDNGLNWASDGNINFGESYSGAVPKPCCLRSFNIKNQRVIAFYSWNQRTTTNHLIMVYAKATDLISSGLPGWNLNTKITETLGGFGGYGDAVHPFNTLEGKFVHYSDFSLQHTETKYITLQTTNYNTLISELGL